MTHLSNYLRSHRRRLALSQDDVAFLLGTIDGAKVCRYERFARVPSLETALALEVILQKPARDLFAGLSRKIEQAVAERAEALLRQMDEKPSNRQTARKRQALASIINSLT